MLNAFYIFPYNLKLILVQQGLFKQHVQKTKISSFFKFGDELFISGALINIDAQGCGTSVVRGPTGHK